MVNFAEHGALSVETPFVSFGKIPRLSRDMIITEKIDGTNAQIYNGDDGEFLVGSRKRWIAPGNDNMGFAKWAYEHKEELQTLGRGHHFGEWWGLGINRNYGLGHKEFSMFNVIRWCEHGTEPQRIITGDPTQEKYQEVLPPCVNLVPLLYRGPFNLEVVECVLDSLEAQGSAAVAHPTFMNPEGVVVYHVAGGNMFKKTLGNDGAKGAKNGGKDYIG